MYDIKIHVPQQLERMLAAESEGNVALFGKTLENLEEMILDHNESKNNNGFIHDIHDYEKQRDKQIDEAKDSFVKAVKDAAIGTNFDSLVRGLNEAQSTLESETSDILTMFMSTVKAYVLTFVKTMEIRGVNE